MVYADVDGNIGYQATGKIPIRASGDGSLPENGSDNAHEWTGYIPFDKLPSSLQSAVGHHRHRQQPHHAGRISLLDQHRMGGALALGPNLSRAGIGQEVFRGRHAGLADRHLFRLPIVILRNASCTPWTTPGMLPPRAKQAAEIMRGWDGRMTADSAAPTIAYRARAELTRLLLEPKLGPRPNGSQASSTAATLNWKTYSWGMQSVWLENVVHHQPQRWLPQTLCQLRRSAGGGG